MPENDIREEIKALVDAVDAADNRISQRAAPRVEVDAQGIHVALRFELEIPGPNPNLDNFVARLPGNLQLHSVRLAADQIIVTACPRAQDSRFLVLATPA